MNIAILLAGGNGKRFGGQKLLALLKGKPVLLWSLETLSAHPEIEKILLVVSKESSEEMKALAMTFPKVDRVLLGGESRFASSLKGFEAAGAQDEDDILLFHNAANPLVTPEEISGVLDLARKYKYGGVGRRVYSALRKITPSGSAIIPRKGMYEMETPQALSAGILEKGIHKWKRDRKKAFSDDLQMAELLGHTPKIFPAHFRNRKITTPEDIPLLSAFLGEKIYRYGIGEDSHQFSEGEKRCVLAGIEIPHTRGFSANSDGDVALHALCNAIFSALGKNSFSHIADEMCQKGIFDSAKYLEKVLEILRGSSGTVENISLAFEGKHPKLEIFFPKMRTRLAELLSLSENGIGLTAHSGEELSAFGQGKGMRVLASALISF